MLNCESTESSDCPPSPLSSDPLAKHVVSLELCAKLPYMKCCGLKQKYLDYPPTVLFLVGVKLGVHTCRFG